MFRTAELGRTVSKEAFEKAIPELRVEMLELQQELRQSDFPVIVLFAGVDGAGKGDTVNLLNAWMDPRWMDTRAYGPPSEEELERPEFWRYWRDLPGRSRIGLFLSAWYSQPVVDHAYGTIDDHELDLRLDRITSFERMLTDDGALILKFWMHLGRDAQKKRLESLAADPLMSWRVTENDWEHWQLYDRFIGAAEHLITRTSTSCAPWSIVEGNDHRYRALAVTTQLRDALRKHLSQGCAAATAEPQASSGGAADEALRSASDHAVSKASKTTVLDTLDTSLKIDKAIYIEELVRTQGRLNSLYREAKSRGISTVLVFEGWDAAGKGGAIRRMTAAMDARDYQVIPVAAPTDEENAQNYMWRFWRHLTRAGRVSIFDRSWYGRVLVERVEGFASEVEWRRAYAEINEFELELSEFGMVVAKFWLHITAEEQLRRFESRQELAYKSWKLTEEDWRNRDRWSEYEQAAHEMIERTSTTRVPWTLVEGNNKRWARLKVINTVAEALEKRLGQSEESSSEDSAEITQIDDARISQSMKTKS